LWNKQTNFQQNKYWLSDTDARNVAPDLNECIDRRYDHLDFVAYDGLRASVPGDYCLWHTDRLINTLSSQLARHGGRLLTGHRLYSIFQTPDAINIRVNSEVIKARLLIDCMGFGITSGRSQRRRKSLGLLLPVVELKSTLEREIFRRLPLDNILIHKRPLFFEFFPTSGTTAHAAVILPTSEQMPDRSMKEDLDFILTKSHYKRPHYKSWFTA